MKGYAHSLRVEVRQACATLDAGEEDADQDCVDACVYESSEHFGGLRVSVGVVVVVVDLRDKGAYLVCRIM